MGEKNPALMSNMIEMRLEENPDKVGLIFENGGLYPDEPLTYREIAASTFKMARAYREFGLRKGDAVATLMRNHPESVFTTGAATLLGMIAVPIDPRTKGEKLGYMLQDCKAKGIITTADLLPEVESVVKNIPGIERIWLNLKPDADPDLAKKYPTINEILAGPDVFEVEGRIDDPNLPMAIIYTSGVTGNPKGVVIKSTRTAMFAQLAPTLIWKYTCLLYTSDAADDLPCVDLGGRRTIKKKKPQFYHFTPSNTHAAGLFITRRTTQPTPAHTTDQRHA